jgi:hypothetical protein
MTGLAVPGYVFERLRDFGALLVALSGLGSNTMRIAVTSFTTASQCYLEKLRRRAFLVGCSVGDNRVEQARARGARNARSKRTA